MRRRAARISSGISAIRAMLGCNPTQDRSGQSGSRKRSIAISSPTKAITTTSFSGSTPPDLLEGVLEKPHLESSALSLVRHIETDEAGMDFQPLDAPNEIFGIVCHQDIAAVDRECEDRAIVLTGQTEIGHMHGFAKAPLTRDAHELEAQAFIDEELHDRP
jgi:hypothetical protein